MKNAVNSPSRSEPYEKEYQSPHLVCYGDVSTITKGEGGRGNDGGREHTKFCWIAEAIYGIDAPRTHLVRAWLTECYGRREPWSLFVVPLYQRIGQSVAVLLRYCPPFKNVLRPVFDLAVRRAHRNQAGALLAMNAVNSAHL